MEDDEDVLFDQAGLISNQVKAFPSLPGSINTAKAFKTTCLCLAFFGLGLVIALPGPTLLDLQANTNSSTSAITSIFTGRSVGYLVGSMVGGGLFDVVNQPFLLSTSMLTTATVTALAPQCRKLAQLVFVMSLQGISMGFLDTGGNVMCLQIWGRKSGPYIQAMHFAFGLGAFVSPLLAEPFLSRQENQTEVIAPKTSTDPANNAIGKKSPKLLELESTPLMQEKRDVESKPNPSGTDGGKTPDKSYPIIRKVVMPETKIEFAYLIVALFVLLVAMLFVVVCCKGRCTWRAIEIEPQDSQFFIRKETMGFRIQILVLLFVFYFLYVGMEVTYGNLILKFAVEYLHWEKNVAALLNALFWGSFAFGRLVAIFLAKCVSAPVMLAMNLILCGLASVGLVLGVDKAPSIVWIGTTMMGLGMASIFPSGIVWAEKYMAVTGKATAIFVVGSALGEMLVPLLTGVLFDSKGEMYLFYVIMSGVLLSAVIFIIMQNLASNMGDRYQSLRLGTIDTEETDVDMDEIHIANNGASRQDAKDKGWKKHVTFQLESSKRKAAIQKVKSPAKRD